MTKEKLIALSDLNREDNIKYISSEAQGIAITLDSDRYAPTFCKLERAYICGRRKSEEQIEELENKIADIKANCDLAIEGRDIKIKELEKENAELKAELEENKDLPAIAYQQGAEWWKKKTEKKLAQAKEIIKEFVYHYNNKTIYVNNVKPLLEQAEQFLLKEIEK